ncbi:MAG: hypothetical protein Q7S64_03290, partial [bacterium]|nr:hypothetical protein [bacterium]
VDWLIDGWPGSGYYLVKRGPIPRKGSTTVPRYRAFRYREPSTPVLTYLIAIGELAIILIILMRIVTKFAWWYVAVFEAASR